jgi:hypothetical protein
MIAQLVLTVLLAAILLYAWHESRRSPVIAFISMLTSLAGLYFVWIPAHATKLAAFAGVGRGVDLILYVWVAISLLVLVNLHLKLRAQTEVITDLARAMALAEAERAAPPQQ